MVTILIVVAVALFFGYAKRYPRDNLIGLGIVGLMAGFLIFGVQVDADIDLAEVGGALDSLPVLFSACQGRKQQRGKDGNNGDNDQ